MITFTIKGVVKDEETGFPMSGLFVKSYDKDLLFDDLLGSAFTDDQGEFEIITELSDFRDFFEKRPDIYFKIFMPNRKTLIHTTQTAVRWNQGRFSTHEILIPWKDMQTEPTISLTGDNGEEREGFSVGDSLLIQVGGLRPGYPHDFTLSIDDKVLFTSSLMTNRHGEIDPTVLWPQMGLDDPHSETLFTPTEAAERWQNKRIRLDILVGEERISSTTFRIGEQFRTPLIISSDQEGRLANGFEVGTQSLLLTLTNLQFSGEARIYMVPRQYGWQVGDTFRPVLLSNGETAVREVELREDEQQTLHFADADLPLPGAYDFIVRPIRYGFEEDELLSILPHDVIGSRYVTGLVIREPFWEAKPVLGGCVNKIPVSGRAVIGSPYFRYGDTFTLGEDIWAALDPGIVDPGNISKMCALYVIQSKDAGAWTNNSLTHLPVLGGNTNTIKRKVQGGCINANKTLIWSNATQPGEYDIVADFGNNTADASAFTPDDAYDTPLDIIDGYFVAGFRVIEDPGIMQEFTYAGNWNYTETDVNAMGMGLTGTVNIQDEATSYHGSVTPTLVTRQLRLKANVFFPTDTSGISDPTQISTSQPNYPLIVIVHGNGHNYTSYDFLLEHFAKNGFIAASIDLRYFNGTSDVHGMRGQGRAEGLFEHLKVLNAAFSTSVQNNIGIMGHSRGGEGVVKAARINQQDGLGHNINAVISLAPTDQYGSEVLGGAWATPYFVLYGSRDGDITGGIWTSGYTVPQTGFALYDRANGATKSMCFVYRATHNGFITNNVDATWDGDAIANMEPIATQQAITKAYMNAFFRQHLITEPKWEGMFTGEWTPGSVSSTGVKFYMQYQDTTTKIVDNFEGTVDWTTSSIGGTVSQSGLPVNPSENKMSAAVVATGLDPKSPHDTKGLKVRWNNSGDTLIYSIPAADKNVSSYKALSFRVTQKVDSADNPTNQSQNFRVALKDGSNKERAIRVSPFYDIPFPDHRPNHSHSKSAMLTARIPLKSYEIVCAGMEQVNLTDITTLTFLFSEKSTGEIEIDNIEFSD